MARASTEAQDAAALDAAYQPAQFTAGLIALATGDAATAARWLEATAALGHAPERALFFLDLAQRVVAMAPAVPPPAAAASPTGAATTPAASPTARPTSEPTPRTQRSATVTLQPPTPASSPTARPTSEPTPRAQRSAAVPLQPPTAFPLASGTLRRQEAAHSVALGTRVSPAERAAKRVEGKPRVVLLTLLPTTIAPHQSATLCVSVVDADLVKVSELGDLPPNQTTCRTVSPAVSTTYIVQAVNRVWRTTRTITLKVQGTLTTLKPVGKVR